LDSDPKTHVDTTFFLFHKGIVHPNILIIPLFTHPQAFIVVYDLFLSAKHNWCYFK